MIKRIVKTIIIDDENDVNVGGIVPEGFSANSVKAVEPDSDVIDVVAGGGSSDAEEIKDAMYTLLAENTDKENPADVKLDKIDIDTFRAFGAYFLHTDSGERYANVSTTSYSKVINRYCKITLPSGIKKITKLAFARMMGLTEIEIDGDENDEIVVNYGAFYCCANLKTVGTMWNYITAVYANSFSCRNGGYFSDTVFELNRDVVAPKLEKIGDEPGVATYAFNRCGFKSFTAPRLKWLGDYTFANCENLETLDFTDLEYITSFAFRDCKNLTHLWLRGNKVATLTDPSAFNGTKALTDPGNFNLHIPQSLMYQYIDDTNWATLINNGAASISVLVIPNT